MRARALMPSHLLSWNSSIDANRFPLTRAAKVPHPNPNCSRDEFFLQVGGGLQNDHILLSVEKLIITLPSSQGRCFREVSLHIAGGCNPCPVPNENNGQLVRRVALPTFAKSADCFAPAGNGSALASSIMLCSIWLMTMKLLNQSLLTNAKNPR